MFQIYIQVRLRIRCFETCILHKVTRVKYTFEKGKSECHQCGLKTWYIVAMGHDIMSAMAIHAIN